jgi:hypothetical protein
MPGEYRPDALPLPVVAYDQANFGRVVGRCGEVCQCNSCPTIRQIQLGEQRQLPAAVGASEKRQEGIR